jgi:hypothetical protein
VILRTLFETIGIWASIVAAIGVIATILIAIWFGWGPWRDRRLSPLLRLVLENSRGPGDSTEPGTRVYSTLRIENYGKGPARNWKIRLAMVGNPGGHIVPSQRVGRPGVRAQGELHFMDAEGRYIIEWWAPTT